MELLRVPLVEAKLRPAALPRVFLKRQRYGSLASSLPQYRLTRVIAPGGYGKTTFLATVASDGVPQTKVAWYTLDEIDGDVAVFLTHLIRSIGRTIPGFGAGAERTLSGVPDLEKKAKIVAASIAEELWQTFAEAPSDLIIVLDDYHSISSARPVNDVVEYLLANIPTNVHLCVASRQDLPLRLERMALQGQVQTIGPADLCFELEEIDQLLNRITGKPWTPDSVREVAESTEGWPAGVVLVGQSSRQGWEMGARDPLSHDREATFRYFAEEIFSRQGESMRSFLTGAAFLRLLTPRSAAAVLGFPNAGDLLNEAVENGLFLTRTEGAEGDVFRFHQVFQAFLRRGVAKDQEISLHRRAAAYYDQQGMLDAAMAHYLDGGMTAEAVGLLERVGLNLIDRGRVDQLRHWLGVLPQKEVDASPRLLYYTGFAYQNSDPARALDCLDRAAKGLANSGDLGLQVRALIYMATIYSLQNQVDKVKEVSARIPIVAAMSKDAWARGVLTVSALCQAAWDDTLKRGVWLFRLARHLPLDPDWQWAMLAYSCMIYYRLGDLDTARKVIEEGLSLPVVKYNDNWLGLGLTLYHVVLYLQDEDKTAELIREDLWNLGEKYDSPYYKAYAERARAFSPYQRGRLEQGRDLLKSSLYFFEKAGNMPMANLTRLDLALLETSFGNAKAVYDEAKEALSALFSLTPGQGLEETAESLFGAVARETGQLEAAERHLLHSAEVSRRKGAKQVLMGTYLHLADLYSGKGQDGLADDYLGKALSLASRNRYRVFWDFHRPTLERQCLRALERGIHADYALYLLSYWFGQYASGAVAALAGRVKGSRRAELLAAASKLQSMSAPISETGGDAWEPEAKGTLTDRPALELRLLGNFEISVKGVPVPEKAWQTRKVKALLKYVLLNRSRRVSREELMELLWPDADPETSAPSLRVTLSRLRRALGPDGAPFLGEERGFAWFEPALPYEMDVEQFERAVSAGVESLKAGDRQSASLDLARAIQIYRGDLLEEDLYEDWPVAERERLQMIYLNALLSLARLITEDDNPDYVQALDLLNKALVVNPYREETYLALMQTNAARGEAAEALRTYERCKKMLRDEFGVAPGREVEQFALRLRAVGH